MDDSKKGRPEMKKEERQEHYFKFRLNDYDFIKFKKMQELSNMNGSDLVRSALRYYAKHMIGMERDIKKRK